MRLWGADVRCWCGPWRGSSTFPTRPPSAHAWHCPTACDYQLVFGLAIAIAAMTVVGAAAFWGGWGEEAAAAAEGKEGEGRAWFEGREKMSWSECSALLGAMFVEWNASYAAAGGPPLHPAVLVEVWQGAAWPYQYTLGEQVSPTRAYKECRTSLGQP